MMNSNIEIKQRIHIKTHDEKFIFFIACKAINSDSVGDCVPHTIRILSRLRYLSFVRLIRSDSGLVFTIAS